MDSTKAFKQFYLLTGSWDITKANIFCLCWQWVKKKNLQKKQPPCVLSVTQYSKTEFSKEKSGLSELPSGKLPGEVTPESCVLVTLHRWAFSRCLWVQTQGWGYGLPSLVGHLPLRIWDLGSQSPASSILSPNTHSPHAPAWVSALSLGCAESPPGNLLSLVGSLSSPAWMSHPVGLPTTLGPSCFRDASRSLVSRRGSKRNPGPHSCPRALVNIYWNWLI